MTKKIGRSSKYETHIKPNFDKIDKMLNDGASEKQVAEALGVSYPAWNKYKVKYKEFGELCGKPRTKLVEDLRSALVKRALGFEYEEQKTVIKLDDDGNKYGYTEKYKKYSVPDTTAIFGALKIYDDKKLEYDIQAQNIDLKKQELELRKMLAEMKDF